MSKHIFDLGMLFASKSGAVVVGVLFLPWYHQLLGETLFGIVAVILSLQALLIMLDMGMATLLARDIASRKSSGGTIDALLMFKQAGSALVLFYIILLLLAVLWFYMVSPVIVSVYDVLALVFLFLTLVLQNLGQSSLIAIKSYVVASSIQIAGVLLRALVTLLALEYIEASLSVFIFSQLAIALIHLLITYVFCYKHLSKISSQGDLPVYLRDIWLLIKRGKPLLLAGMAGAAVMQLDKPIILYFMSAADVGAYFLAMSFSMLPLFVLAAPVAQFFQPRITEAISAQDFQQSRMLLWKLFLCLMLFVALPTLCIEIFEEDILFFWLHDEALVASISEYVSVLLLAAVFGAFGYIPYVILIAVQDFKFQANLSLVLTVLTLALVFFFAYQKLLYFVCLTYLGYHICTLFCLLLRSQGRVVS